MGVPSLGRHKPHSRSHQPLPCPQIPRPPSPPRPRRVRAHSWQEASQVPLPMVKGHTRSPMLRDSESPCVSSRSVLPGTKWQQAAAWLVGARGAAGRGQTLGGRPACWCPLRRQLQAPQAGCSTHSRKAKRRQPQPPTCRTGSPARAAPAAPRASARRRAPGSQQPRCMHASGWVGRQRHEGRVAGEIFALAWRCRSPAQRSPALRTSRARRIWRSPS